MSNKSWNPSANFVNQKAYLKWDLTPQWEKNQNSCTAPAHLNIWKNAFNQQTDFKLISAIKTNYHIFY